MAEKGNIDATSKNEDKGLVRNTSWCIVGEWKISFSGGRGGEYGFPTDM